MSLRSLSILHWAILPNRSERVRRVVATIGDKEDVELSSDPEESGEPGRFFVRSFLILVSKTGSVSFSFLRMVFFIAAGGAMPATFMTFPDGLRGLGGGGWRRGSVGLSEMGPFTGLLRGGGVIGLGTRRGIGDGDGGRGRVRIFGEACFTCPVFRERDTDNERDLDLAWRWFLGEQTEQESSEQLLTELPEGDRRPLCIGGDRGERGLTALADRAGGGGDLRVTGGDRRDGGDLGDRRPTGDRRKAGERGDLRPIGDRREGGDRGDLRPTGDRERLRRLGDGDDEPSK